MVAREGAFRSDCNTAEGEQFHLCDNVLEIVTPIPEYLYIKDVLK
jgi:hypothetical protein